MEGLRTVEGAVCDTQLAPGDLTSRAAAAAAVACQHAAGVDRDSLFPADALAALKAQRLLGILAPTALGGEGCGVADVVDVCYRLGQSCAATGMIYAMHQIMVACIVRHMQRGGALENLIRRLCAKQLLLASSTTEGRNGGDVRSSEAPIQHKDDRISLERHASVISYGAHADGIVTHGASLGGGRCLGSSACGIFKS